MFDYSGFNNLKLDDDPFGLLDNAILTSDDQQSTSKIKDSQTDEVICDLCSCGGALKSYTNGYKKICDDCGLVSDTDGQLFDGLELDNQVVTCLRIVGPGSSQLQSDLYKSGTANTSNQKARVFEDLQRLKSRYASDKGKNFPTDVLKLTAEYYHDVQKECVKRNNNKKCILAACLRIACWNKDFAPSNIEIAEFMGLDRKGFAKGEKFILTLVAAGRMDININSDPTIPTITTIFAIIGLIGVEYDELKQASFCIVDVALDNNIGTSSVIRSKVAGAIYDVILRSQKSEKFKKLFRTPIGNREFYSSGMVKKNTVDKFLTELFDYHSYFVNVYKKYGLIDILINYKKS